MVAVGDISVLFWVTPIRTSTETELESIGRVQVLVVPVGGARRGRHPVP